MVVLTHAPESCGWRSEETGALFGRAFSSLRQVAGNHGASVQGAWVNTAAHRHYVLVDAPNAHAVNALLSDAGLLAIITCEVTAVEDFTTALG
jgi:hypothetical protein